MGWGQDSAPQLEVLLAGEKGVRENIVVRDVKTYVCIDVAPTQQVWVLE